MLRLPSRFAAVILSFAPLFSRRSWRRAEVLLIGAILVPGKRTVTSLLRIAGLRKVFQCNRCKKQVRLTAGTVFQDTKLPLTTWFSAIYHLAQSQNGISSDGAARRRGA